MMIFTMASGLTLVFGLMDVLNFGHGAFISLGAYVATLVFAAVGRAGPQPTRWPLNLALLGLALARSGRRLRRRRLRVRARAHRPGLRPAPQADPGRRSAARSSPSNCSTRCSARRRSPLPLPAELPRLVRLRRRGDREIPRRRDAVGLVVFAALMLILEPHQDRPADPRRRGEPRDGRGARLSHRPAVRRRVHGGLGAGRPRRRAVGALPRAGARLDGRRIAGADVHRHHRRRPRLGRRLLHRRGSRRADRQLRRLPRAEAGAGLQHPADGRGAAVAAARPLSGGGR